MEIREETVEVGSDFWKIATNNGEIPFPKTGKIVDNGVVVGTINYTVKEKASEN